MKIGQEGQGLSLAGFADEADRPVSCRELLSLPPLLWDYKHSVYSILGVKPRSSSLPGKLFTDSSISPVLKLWKESCFNNFFPAFRGDPDLAGWPSARQDVTTVSWVEPSGHSARHVGSECISKLLRNLQWESEDLASPFPLRHLTCKER